MEPLELLKWVLIVFIAGFIGYFGKQLGAWIISKFKKKDKVKKQTNPKETVQYIKETQGMNKYEYKLAKKKLKVKKKK